MQSGDWSKAINELENFGDSYSSRRNSEAQYLQASLDPSKRTQAFNGLQTANAEGKMGGANGMTVIAPNVTKVNHNSTQSMVAQGRAVDLSRQSKMG